jgi:hypothetical protein
VRSSRQWIAVLAASAALVGVVGTPSAVAAAPSATPSTASSAAPPGRTTPAAPSALADPDRVLPAAWRASADQAVTVAGDATGLHVLVAHEASGYAWRTAATLADDAYDADSCAVRG